MKDSSGRIESELFPLNSTGPKNVMHNLVCAPCTSDRTYRGTSLMITPPF